MDKKIRIAFLQIKPGQSLTENIEIGERACHKAKEKDCDIALFPEMFSCGYTIPQDAEELSQMAIDEESVFVHKFAELSKRLEIAIGITLLEKGKSAPKNSIYLYDRFGKQVYKYAKVHTCDFGLEGVLERGEDFFVEDLDTRCGLVKVGSMICFDREFPESARILMLKGAELILVPNACPMEINRVSQLRGRAYENMTAIATCNYPGGYQDSNGHSTLFDGIAFELGKDASRDMCVLECPEEEGVYTADLDLDMLRRYRSVEVQGNAFRRPDKYNALINTQIEEPFVRKSHRS